MREGQELPSALTTTVVQEKVDMEGALAHLQQRMKGFVQVKIVSILWLIACAGEPSGFDLNAAQYWSLSAFIVSTVMVANLYELGSEERL